MEPVRGEQSDDDVRGFSDALTACGLDLVRAFDIADYNRLTLDHEQLRPVPTFGREHASALLIGNTKALWRPLLSAYASRPDLRRGPDPLDTYVTEVITEAASRLLEGRYVLRFGHIGGGELVSMLHLAEASGLAERGPVHLAVHPSFGPWFALRALVVRDREPSERAPRHASLCEPCPAPCRAAFDRAQRVAGAGWRDWLAVRDACPVGVAHRYEEAQLAYHYTKDRASLDDRPREDAT